MLHDPKTVIGSDFDQETAEKLAPQFIARLELANCTNLGVSDRASSDKRGYCCADGRGGSGWRHCGGRRGRCRGQAGGGGGCRAGDWSTSTSEDSTLDRALCRTCAQPIIYNK